jgi:uncharacterized protein YutE (UPF0331/DUF86 family)
MVDADLVSAKLAELTDRLARVRRHRRPSAQDLAADRDALELVSFNLMLAIQTCLDVASHIIADEGWPPATDLAGSFRRLGEQGVISEGLAREMARAAGLRNIVAHLYAGIEAALIHAAASESLVVLDRYAAEVSTWVREQR